MTSETSAQTTETEHPDEETGLSQADLGGRLNQESQTSASSNDLPLEALNQATATPSTSSENPSETLSAAKEPPPNVALAGNGILEAIEEDDLEFASQDEIDKLLKGMQVLDEDVAGQGPASKSQGDRDQSRRPLGEGHPQKGGQASSEPPEALFGPTEEETGVKSQDDINDLITGHRGAVGNARTSSVNTGRATGISGDKLDQAWPDAGAGLAGKDADTDAEPQAEPEAEQEDQAVLISQEDLDRLLQSATVTDDDSGAAATDDSLPADGSETPPTEAQTRLSSSFSPLPPQESRTPPLAEQPTEFISQDDLDQLLAGGQQQGESEVPEATAITETVILEADEQEVQAAAAATVTEASADAPAGSRSGSRKVWIIITTCLVIVSLPLAWLVIGRLKHRSDPAAAVQSFPVHPVPDPQQLAQRQPIAAGGAIEMPGFIVLAPLERMDVSFLAADVTLRFESAQAGEDVRRHYPFFRYIVYQALISRLAEGPKDLIDPVSLQVAIKEAFSRTLPVEAMQSLRMIEIQNLTVG